MPPDAALAALAAALGVPYDGPGVVVDDVHHDSRAVRPGSLFVAVRGEHFDGHDYAPAAVAAGASALVVEAPLPLAVPQLVVPSSRRALPVVAAEVHGHPSKALTVIGVTGTNGKTTVTHMIEAIARAAGRVPGVIGTVGARADHDPLTVTRTTPEASDLQRILRLMLERGVELVALEVSSHALALGRVDGLAFAAAAFTNLSQDHLDFHRDMADYFEAKASLFTPARSRIGVVWVEDEWGRLLADRSPIPVRTVGTSAACDVWASAIAVDTRASRFLISAADRSAEVVMPLPGRFNVANALVAAACAIEVGIDLGEVVRGLETLPPVPGRLEVVPGDRPFIVIVDYAHSPDAISAVVAEARLVGARRVIAVIGAGGDRDREKRPLMGAAATGADLAVITSDNPRSENPDEIIAQVMAGARPGAAVVVEPDRRAAIRHALAAAGPGDVVLVLGKGHEQGQEWGGRIEPFDDRVVAAEEWRSLGEGGS
jgi:UDP-N-acetylmuramoyl-L-alanyl-D-glutamate--2,6-diaminopimelate ligase